MVSTLANYRFIPVISGFPAQHEVLRLDVDARCDFRNHRGAGVTFERLRCRNNYTDRSDFLGKSSGPRAFVITAVPRWEDFE
jgi:hypothetical protein